MNLAIPPAVLALTLGILAACRSEPEFPAQAGAVDDALKQDLALLRDHRIYFGHQSVGQNILEGLSELVKEAGETRFAIADLDKGQSLTAGGIAHAHIGRNLDPRSKCDAFSKTLGTAAPNVPHVQYDMAALKFCYLDVDSKTDVASLFAYYKTALESAQAMNPSMVIVYVTVPLKTGMRGRLAGIKRLLGLHNRNDTRNDADNLRRAEFNGMLRQAFAGKPGFARFDLAAVESTYPDGSRESFQKDGKTGYRLLNSLSSDGGHLNDLGKRVAAKAFLHALAAAAGGPMPTASARSSFRSESIPRQGTGNSSR